MGIRNLVSLICLLLVLLCWAAMFSGFSLAGVILSPIILLAGFIVSIFAIRSKDSKVLAWVLFSLQTLLLLGYICIIIYGIFWWNPKFF